MKKHSNLISPFHSNIFYLLFFCSVVIKQEPKDEDEDITENGQTVAEDDSKEAGELVCENSCLKFSAEFWFVKYTMQPSNL